jgi:hypothetical protein
VRSDGVKLFGEIFLDELVQIPVGAGSQLAQIFRERAHVLVILLGIERQRFERELAFHPVAVKRMLQQVMLMNECVERFEQRSDLLLSHDPPK